MRISAALLPPTISQWQKSPHVFDAFIKGLEKKIKVLAKASTRIIPFPKLCQLTSALCFHGDHCYIQHKNYAKAHNCHLWQVFSRLHRSSSSTSQKVTMKYSQIIKLPEKQPQDNNFPGISVFVWRSVGKARGATRSLWCAAGHKSPCHYSGCQPFLSEALAIMNMSIYSCRCLFFFF